jgi:putative redox protein
MDYDKTEIGGNMPGVNVKWTGGTQFLASDEAGHVVVTDSEGQGMKPPEVFLASLVGCTGIDVVRILEKKRQQFSSIEVSVTRENEPDPPWTIKKIVMEWVVRGRNLKQKAVEDAIRLAEEGYCSVAASLKSDLVTIVRIVDEAEGSE